MCAANANVPSHIAYHIYEQIRRKNLETLEDRFIFQVYKSK